MMKNIPTTFKANIFPLVIFLSIWLFVITLYCTSPYKYNEISFKGWIFIFLSLTSFIMGYLVYYILSFDTIEMKNSTIDNINKPIKPIVQVNTNTTMTIIYIMGVISLVGVFWKLNMLGKYVGGVYEYLKNPIRARFYVTLTTGKIVEGYNIYDTMASYLINLNLVNSMFGGVLFGSAKKFKLSAWIPIVIAVLISVITFQRYIFLLSITIWMVSALYIGYHLSPEARLKAFNRFKLALIVIIILFVLFVVLLLLVRLNIDEEITGDSNKISVREIVLRSLHSYLVGNIVNFDNFIHRTYKYYYGSSLLRNLFKWFARLGLYEESNVIGTGYEFSDVGFTSLNTYSFMRIFYEDFGVIGLIGMSFLWGLGSSWMVRWYLEKFSLYRLYYLTLMCHSLLMSFFSFSLLNIIVILFATLIIFIINHTLPPLAIKE